jgi:hypothetical protein
MDKKLDVIQILIMRASLKKEKTLKRKVNILMNTLSVLLNASHLFYRIKKKVKMG